MNKYIDAEKLRSVLQNTINSMKEKDAKGEDMMLSSMANFPFAKNC